MNVGMRHLIIPMDIQRKIAAIPQQTKDAAMAAVLLQYEPQYKELPAHFGADITFWLWEKLKEKRGLESVHYADDAEQVAEPDPKGRGDNLEANR